MADPTFREFQIDEETGIHKECSDIEVGVGLVEECLPCKPNPNAIVPDWRSQKFGELTKNDGIDLSRDSTAAMETQAEPFLNERTCEFCIAVRTYYQTGTEAMTDTDQDSVLDAFNNSGENISLYIEPAIRSMLQFYDKDETDDNVAALLQVTKVVEYDTSIRPLIKMKVLICVPALNFYQIDDAPQDTEAPETNTSIRFEINALRTYIRHVKHAFSLYGRYQEIFYGMQQGALTYIEDGSEIRIGASWIKQGIQAFSKEYKDTTEEFNISEFQAQLFSFLRRHRYKLRGSPRRGLKVANEIELGFGDNYSLEYIKVYEEGCEDNARVFKGNSIAGLADTRPFNRPTTMGYITALPDMDNDIIARESLPWLEFMVKYTYPSLQVDYGDGLATANTSFVGCVADNINVSEYGDFLRQTLLKFPDIVAAKFNEELCASIEDRPTRDGEFASDDLETVISMAKEQAVMEFLSEYPLFANLPSIIDKIKEESSEDPTDQSDGRKKISIFWDEVIGKLKQCGLYAFSLRALECLLAGMDFNEALGLMLQAALKAMNIHNFGQLLVGLPPTKQQEIHTKVQEKIAAQGGLAAVLGIDPDDPDFNEEVQFQKLSTAITAAHYSLPEAYWSDDVWWTDGGGWVYYDAGTGDEYAADWMSGNASRSLTVQSSKQSQRMSSSPGGSTATGTFDSKHNYFEGFGEDKKTNEEARTRSTLGPKVSEMGGQAETIPGIIFQAYLESVFDVYSEGDSLSDLLKELNKFPGAEIIARVLTAFDCPVPPLFDPSIKDFIKSLDLGICRNQKRVKLPKMWNPMAWLAELDLLAYIRVALKEKFNELVYELMMRLIEKLLQALFDSLCTLVGLPGELLLGDLLQESLCAGAEGSPEDAEQAIADIFDSIGVSNAEGIEAGGSALDGGSVLMQESNRDPSAINNLLRDISNVLTPCEVRSLVLGNPKRTTLILVAQIVNIQHPSFSGILGTPEKVAKVFSTIGSLIPGDTRRSIAACDLIEDLGPEVDPIRARILSSCDVPPSEEPCKFAEVRRDLLINKGTSEEEAEYMVNALCERNSNEAADILDIMQKGPANYLMENLPPLLDAPGCPNTNKPALAPRDPEEIVTIVNDVTDSIFEIAQQTYVIDLVGRKGMVNMLMSDTLGKQFTKHQGYAAAFDAYVDYPGASKEDEDGDYEKRERGYLPTTIARWLREDLVSKVMLMDPNNITDIDPMDQIGYPMRLLYPFQDSALSFDFYTLDASRIKPSKALTHTDATGIEYNLGLTSPQRDPDLTLSFRDNNRGDLSLGKENNFDYGFDLDYYSYIVELDDGDGISEEYEGSINVTAPTGDAYSDIYRIVISDVIGAPRATGQESSKNVEYDITVIGSLSEDVLAEIASYNSLGAFSNLGEGSASPQQEIWKSLISNNFKGNTTGADTSAAYEFIKTTAFNKMQTRIFADFMSYLACDFSDDYQDDPSIGSRSTQAGWPRPPSLAFKYGRFIDPDLTDIDLTYVNPDYIGAYSSDAEKIDSEALYSMPEEMQLLGGSATDNSRVHFLDPAKYGGRYSNPPFYVSPPQKDGWLGLVEALVPELDGCEPKRSMLIDFNSIKKRVNDLYTALPDDPRLNYNPDCVVEVPYARILDRNAASGLEGSILAIIRTYVSEAMLQAMPAFTTFQATPEVFDPAFIYYIMEVMEESMKEDGKLLGPFKNENYWYAFLEQSVQTYGRQYADGEVIPPSDVEYAINQINNMQLYYIYPSRSEWVGRGTDPTTGYEWNNAATVRTEVFEEMTNRQVVPTGLVATLTTELNTLKKYRNAKNLYHVKITENHAKTVLKEMIVKQMKEISIYFRDMLEPIGMAPEIDDLGKYFISSVAGICIGSRLNEEVGVPGESTDAGPNCLDVAPSSNHHPLDNGGYGLGDNPVSVLKFMQCGNDSGTFILEKYIAVEDIYEAGETEYPADSSFPDFIANRSDNLRGVVNLQEFAAWLNSVTTGEATRGVSGESYTGDSTFSDMEANLSDYFGDLKFVYDGLVTSGETSEDAGHVHSYLVDDNGNGVAYEACHEIMTDICHAHEIVNFEVLENHSRWGGTHIHELAFPEGTAPSGIEGSTGLRYGLRLSYILPPSATAAFEGVSSSDSIDSVIKDKAHVLPAPTMSNDAGTKFLSTGEWAAAEARNSAATDYLSTISQEMIDDVASGLRYVIPITSVEIDIVDKTISELAAQFEESLTAAGEINFNIGMWECLINKLVKDSKFNLLIKYIFPLPKLLSIMTIYTAKGFLPAIGEHTTDYRDNDKYGWRDDNSKDSPRDDGEWDTYKNRKVFLGLINSPFDRWNRSLFKKTKKYCRNMFLGYYNDREFEYQEDEDEARSFRELLESLGLFQSNLDHSLRWWRRRKLSSRPFDKDGNEC